MRDKSACKMEARSMPKSSKLGCKILQNPLKICPSEVQNRAKRRLGKVLGCLGVSWRHLGAFWRRLGASWEHLGTSWGRLGGVLGASWGCLGASWSLLGASWDRCGTSWKRPASDSNQKLDFFIDFCLQLRPPKPSKSNPRCMENTLLKMRF